MLMMITIMMMMMMKKFFPFHMSGRSSASENHSLLGHEATLSPTYLAVILTTACSLQLVRAQQTLPTPATSSGPVTVHSGASQSDGADRGIESEVLGPLRIWHIVFIIGVMLLTALIIVCCCCHFRIPRTRQEIEENFHKRTLNKQYLHILERRPEELLKRHQGRPGVSVTEASRKITTKAAPLAKGNVAAQKRTRPAGVTRASTAGAARGETDLNQRRGETETYSPVTRPRPKLGAGTPLALHARDVLALMSQENSKMSKGNGRSAKT